MSRAKIRTIVQCAHTIYIMLTCHLHSYYVVTYFLVTDLGEKELDVRAYKLTMCLLFQCSLLFFSPSLYLEQDAHVSVTPLTFHYENVDLVKLKEINHPKGQQLFT